MSVDWHNTCLSGAAIQHLNCDPARSTQWDCSTARSIREDHMLKKSSKTKKKTTNKKSHTHTKINFCLSVWMPPHIPSAGKGKGSCRAPLTLRWSYHSAFGICLPSCPESSHKSSTSAPLMVAAGDRFGATLKPTQLQPGSHWGFHQYHRWRVQKIKSHEECQGSQGCFAWRRGGSGVITSFSTARRKGVVAT